MYLKDLIEELENAPKEQIVKIGFNSPHSYRGYYEELAFEPAENITVGEMLEAANSALGAVFHGYKGGEFLMKEYTNCHLANYGHTGEKIGPILLKYMLYLSPFIPEPTNY